MNLNNAPKLSVINAFIIFSFFLLYLHFIAYTISCLI